MVAALSGPHAPGFAALVFNLTFKRHLEGRAARSAPPVFEREFAIAAACLPSVFSSSDLVCRVRGGNIALRGCAPLPLHDHPSFLRSSPHREIHVGYRRRKSSIGERSGVVPATDDEWRPSS